MRYSISLALILIVSVLSSVGFAQESDQISPDYIIKPNDNITTYIYGNPELNIDAVVPPDGNITFPLVGEVYVIGITPEKLSRILEERLGFYIVEPKVTILVTAYNPLKVYILGAVRSPGAYNYVPGQRLTDYLTLAGGFDVEANLKKCLVYSVKEGEEVIEYDLQVLLEKRMSDLDIELQPYDTIYVKERSGFLFTEWRDIADALSIILGVFTLYFVISSR